MTVITVISDLLVMTVITRRKARTRYLECSGMEDCHQSDYWTCTCANLAAKEGES